ncbi:hypothetical protein SAMN04488543_0197 [Friedmanniella luteola]|uniref:Uncharacterized protein n=1 Tax=Friedmanniella luteola TaxID=546871 RepID=A0A1H1LBQ3_9ACTN|nr:hypothetical protein [Friedmanniella luteola]SDR72021.1 hypothetical protein SAMN04488543_0197 [Friedmanniella luteola]
MPSSEHPETPDDRQPEAVLRVSVHADAGPQPASRSAALVEEALLDCDASPGTPVSVAVPAGDGAMVARLHDLLDEDEARRAGATVIVDGVLPGGD